MDDDNRQRLQRLYEAAAALAATEAFNTIAPTRNNIGADEILNRQLWQQNHPLQGLSHSNGIERRSCDERQSYEDPLNWIQQDNPTQQLQNLTSFGASNSSGTLSLERRLYQAIGASSGIQPGIQDPSMSLLMRSIQQRKIEIELASQSQYCRELMQNTAMTQGDVGNIGVDSFLNGTSGLANWNQCRLGSLSRQQLPFVHQNISSTQNIPILTETDPQLSVTVENMTQLNAPSTSGYLNTTGMNDLSLSQQLYMDEYLRSQQAKILAFRQPELAYQNQQLEDMYGGQSRLAFLLHQRQQLERQSFAEPLPVARNISLNNDEPEDTEEIETAKIRQVEAFIEKPKRPLSAYNVFFRQERQKLLGDNAGDEGNVLDTIIGAVKEDVDVDDKKPAAVVDVPGSKKRKRGKPHHKVTFEEMAKIIGQRWKELESDESKKKHYQDIAQKDKERYQAEIAAWKKQRNALSSKYRKTSDAAHHDGK